MFLDFAGTPTFRVGLLRLDDSATFYTAPNGRTIFDTFQYDAAQRLSVMESMRRDYQGFNVAFTDVRPTSGEYQKLEMNNTAIRRVTPTQRIPNIYAIETDDDGDGVSDRNRFSVLFGSAGGIDFRNKYLGNTGYADANFFAFAEQAGITFSSIPSGASTESLILAQAGLTGSHELGHNLGLRHHDALGPVGGGVNGLGSVGVPGNYFPAFPGPVAATTTNLHIMASGASTGRPLNPLGDRRFGVREAIKLGFNEQGITREEDRLRSVQSGLTITLPTLPLPDGTIVPGDETGFVDEVRRVALQTLRLPLSAAERATYRGTVTAKATNIEGRIVRPEIARDGSVTLVDLFALDLGGGAHLSIEALVNTPEWLEENFFPFVAIFDQNFEMTRYFDADAISSYDGEGGDPFLFDWLVPESGRYYVGIWSPYNLVDAGNPFLGRGEFISGKYELYITSVLVPAPAMLALFGLGVGAMMARRRRRR